jgi:hypothetical protein
MSASDLSAATVKKFLDEKKLTSNWDSFVIHNTKQQGNNNADDKDLRELVKRVSENTETRKDLMTNGKPDSLLFFVESAQADQSEDEWHRRATRVFPAATNSSEIKKTEALDGKDDGKDDSKQPPAPPVSEAVPVALGANTDEYIKSNIEDGCYHDIMVVVNRTTYHVQCPLYLKNGSCIVHSENKGRSNMWTNPNAIEMDEFKRSKSRQVETVINKIAADLSKVTDDSLTALSSTMARLTLAVSS